MDRTLLRKAKEYNMKHHRNSIRRKLVRFLGCVVVFCTTYALILPAITQEKATFCGMEEHIHGAHCYVQVEEAEEKVLVCTEPEVQIHAHAEECYTLLPGHMHDENCYTLLEKQLICGLEEVEAHAHSDACYGPGENLLCTIAEAHVHAESCYSERVLTCGYDHEHNHGDGCYGRSDLNCSIEENHAHDGGCYTPETLICENTEEGHEHGSGCYSKPELVCSKKEGHTHDDSCYDFSLQCGEEEHNHGDGCWSAPELICVEPENHVHDAGCYELTLLCSLEESEGHVHTEECYEQFSILSCEMEESEDTNVLVCEIPEEQVHIHEGACYEVVSVMELSCGLPEGENHAHTELCYGTWNLNCAIEEHTHSLICYSDKNADVESKSDWKRTFSDVKLTGNWAEDVLAIAQTQLGYRESTKNYIVLEDGETQKGYTRYGDWYGLPYEDWGATFASFCIHYAEVEDMPLEADCQNWIKKLSAKGMYQKAGSYDPVPGDLIFFDWDDDGKAEHVGFVAKNKGIIETIEGNSDNRVAKKQYNKNDRTILGYGVLPVNPDYVVVGENQSGVYDEDSNLLYVVDNPETSVEPTAEPTAEMTAEPSVAPTVAPTAEMTAEPSVEPTVAPTAEMTVEPSVEPTVAPTAETTAEPSVEPTVAPTAEMTVEPSVEPTVAPTAEMTAEPSVEPTVAPTAETTAEPSVEPTVAPTAEMAVEPSVVPTAEPTMQPAEDILFEQCSDLTVESTTESTVVLSTVPFDAPNAEITADTQADGMAIVVDILLEELPEERTESEHFCGYAEHVHSEECFDAEGNLNCTEIEHTHDETCLIAEEPVIEYFCGYEEHIHSEECFDEEGNLICVEIEHTHDESCLIAEEPVIEYFCGLAEHVHGEECFDAEGNLICAEAEHTHDESCLIVEEPVIEYFCGLAEHVHSEECFDAEGNLICIEVEHTHDESCLIAEEPVIEYFCGYAEHIHSEECFDAEGNLICTEIEHTHDESCLIAEEPVIEYFCGYAEHVHGEECFDAEGNLICVEIEHTHDESCLIAEEPVIEYFCGYAEHVHGEECFDEEGNLICVEIEHTHDESCLIAEEPVIEYFCGYEEHIHSEECFDEDGNLICIEVEHTHDESCLIAEEPVIEYFCGYAEHVHGEECFDAEGNLICAEAEHTHDESCLIAEEPVIEYFCGYAEHVHGEECFDAEGNLICTEIEHTHDEICLVAAEFEIEYLCGLAEHIHSEECFDAEGNLICTEIEHIHDEMCCPDEGCFCGQKGHVHTETCYDAEGNLICIYPEHAHTLVCTTDLRDLNEDIRRQVEELILLIEEMPSADQIDERIMEYELVEDYEGEEAWLTGLYQQVSYIYHRYARLAPEVQERVVNRDKLLELEYIWSAVPLVDTEIAHTIAYSPDMFTENALFVVYAKSGNTYYAFDGNGNAVPIIIDADGTIVANTNNKNELLWSFAYQSENTYLIQNAATGRYMHAYPNNGSGVTTSGAYSSVLLETNGGVQIRSNSEYAYLDAVNSVFSMTQLQAYAAVYNFGITYENYVWLDGTNGGLMSLGGSPNTGFLVTDGTFILPETWESPQKYEYELRGWYDIINRQYYAPGSEVAVTENMVFYADWVAASYNIGRFNSHVADTESTSSFITTRVYDYSTIFNMYSVTADVTVNAAGHSETWTLNTGADSLNYIFRDWDATGKISYPNNTNADNTNGGVNTGLYNRQLAEMLFGTGSDVLGKQYIGKGDHLFQYGDDPNEPEHYGYYYYDSHLNAASYNRSAGRFYVYDYLERTSDSAGSSRYADFLPFNSPYANTNGKTVQTYSHNGVTNYGYDAKYNTDGNSTNNVGTNYWFGMRTDIEFYLPNSPGTRDSEGNLANSSLYGDEVVFEFSGDDDVWVLVDGNLVLDLGGIHGDEHGSINFSTGVVEVNGTTSGSVANLPAGNHTLTLLYLERGSSLSNCKIRFNLSSRYALTLQKEDVLTRELLDGAEFSVYTDRACTQPAELWPSQAAHDRGEAATNVFVVKNGKADMWGLAAGNTYYIKETKSPDGGYDFTRGIIVMQLNNKGVASYDVVADGGSLTGGFTVHGYRVDLESQEAFMNITNGRNVEEITNITVRKRWNDDLDHSGDSVTVYLVVDGVRIREETLSAANNWQFTWENMPMYYQDGVTEVNYIIQEGTVSGYVGGIEMLPPGTYQTTDWVHADAFKNNETYLIHSYEGYLSASNGRISFVADEAAAANSAASRWKASVSGGSVYLTNEAGQKLHYSSNDWRFKAASNANSGTKLVFDKGRFYYNRGNNELSYICNLASDGTGTLNAHTYDSAVIYTPYRKVTENVSIPEGDVNYRITNSPVGEEETVSLTVYKEWSLGTLGTTAMYETLTIPVKLMENGIDSGLTADLSLRNDWSATFRGLPKYDANGNPVSYTVKEDWISPEWSPRYGEIIPVSGSNNSYTTTITNVCTLTYMLPETGGCGRTWYTAGGLLLILAAGAILLYKRRYQCGRGER